MSVWCRKVSTDRPFVPPAWNVGCDELAHRYSARELRTLGQLASHEQNLQDLTPVKPAAFDATPKEKHISCPEDRSH
jgi:hypothetical protein